MTRRIVFGFLALAFAGLIVFTSLRTGSSYSEAGSILGAWVNAVFFGNRLNVDEVQTIVTFGSKFIGHFSLFAVDGLFAYLFCKEFPKNKALFAVIFVVFGLFMSIAGETIQMFVEERNPSLADVLIDYSGFLLIPLVWTFCRKLNRG